MNLSKNIINDIYYYCEMTINIIHIITIGSGFNHKMFLHLTNLKLILLKLTKFILLTLSSIINTKFNNRK